MISPHQWNPSLTFQTKKDGKYWSLSCLNLKKNEKNEKEKAENRPAYRGYFRLTQKCESNLPRHSDPCNYFICIPAGIRFLN